MTGPAVLIKRAVKALVASVCSCATSEVPVALFGLKTPKPPSFWPFFHALWAEPGQKGVP